MVTGHIWILPSDPVVHVGTGGQLNLDCVVDTGPVQPQFILWYRDDRIVAYDDNIDAEVKTLRKFHHKCFELQFLDEIDFLKIYLDLCLLLLSF